MILQKEIREQSKAKGVSTEIIDKDWVLGHVLKGIFETPNLGEHLIFKGGTCLKKCFFPNYRFSEDLDFTATTDRLNINEDLINRLCQTVQNNAGIQLVFSKIKKQLYKNEQVGYEIKIKYWGANHSRNVPPPPASRWQTSIKIDANWYEKMLFKPLQQPILHDYSDAQKFKELRIPTYSIEEVLAEKLRALIQRKYAAARDYFDIWTLNKRLPDLDWELIKQAFFEKCQHKGIVFESVQQFLNEDIYQKLDRQWEANLKRQLRKEDYFLITEIYPDLEKLFSSIF
ncbi:MAG: nucleotidyl transferase AbiEii/AbiGii toxin family protein [Bacteroidota bacterium]